MVSLSANGINASARADLINRHLALWQQLTTSGRGGLVGAFRDAATGEPRRVDFRHRVDLHRVATLGHSRGGAGVTWQAADRTGPSGPRASRPGRSWRWPPPTT
ncbi:hypothetical protein Snoj_00940 [Streptomyces nojiriensis]|uniref:Uncharacterized protein n=1 Tax=Streptomyces nojiriensis TaxID=66374 RepID=A0ABQ3SDH1_9ACTN|nr:hypothetical protein GCM10010205_75850 [Streptomyces nojiriensis]GHI66176.1 hypothetical protein Snoj_00940 [Streptomyces nojiriensis]